MNEYDFTALVDAALKGCKEYNKVDWAQLRSDEIATYSIGQEAIDVLEDTVGADLDKYCTNKEEVKANNDRTMKNYQDHLRSCDKVCCENLLEARIAIGAMERD